MTPSIKCGRSGRRLHIVSDLLIAAGVLGLALVLGIRTETKVYDWIDNAKFEEDLATARNGVNHNRHTASEVPALVVQQKNRSGRDSTKKPVPELPMPRRSNSDILGRLEIPRLGFSTLVRDGIDPRTLRRGAGHLPGSAQPGQPGNFVVAGHRDTVFRDLRLIRSGDRLRVVTPDGEFEYTVVLLAVVSPVDVEFIRETSEPTCTLITCFPFGYFGAAPRRFIVKARANFSAHTRSANSSVPLPTQQDGLGREADDR